MPGNPVDLEQREGRVHRYKGHAVRKNVAADFRAVALLSPNEEQDQHRHQLRQQDQHEYENQSQNTQADPWDAMFDAAERERDPEASDIVPYWVYPKEGGASIERYVPTMPFSREERHLTGLLRSVSEYRQVIGQPRQDDFRRFLSDVDDDLRDELGVNLEPPSRVSIHLGQETND